MANKQYGTWVRGYSSVQDTIEYLQDSLLENGLSINQVGRAKGITIKYIYKPADDGADGFTAIKVEWEDDNEQAP